MIAKHLSDGKQAEMLAEKFLLSSGAEIICRNYRSPQGEIDLIVTLAQRLLFVEVRLRRGNSFGNAADSITLRKQRRIISAAESFLAEFPSWQQYTCRFDCIFFSELSLNTLQWVEDAFQVS